MPLIDLEGDYIPLPYVFTYSDYQYIRMENFRSGVEMMIIADRAKKKHDLLLLKEIEGKLV